MNFDVLSFQIIYNLWWLQVGRFLAALANHHDGDHHHHTESVILQVTHFFITQLQVLHHGERVYSALQPAPLLLTQKEQITCIKTFGLIQESVLRPLENQLFYTHWSNSDTRACRPFPNTVWPMYFHCFILHNDTGLWFMSHFTETVLSKSHF